MSVIQSIREKYAKWAVVAIALALLGFILTDYFSAQNRMGPGNSTTLGSVNGKKIDYIKFEERLKILNDQSEAQAQNSGQPFGEVERSRNNESLWNQEIEQIIMGVEFEKLGFNIGKKELNDWLFGLNPPADLKQRFTDQQGNYDAAAAQNAINQMKRSTVQAEREQLNVYINSLEYSRKYEKYNSLLSNSVYYPKWYLEKQNAESGAIAKASYVSYPYTNINDTTVRVTDREIEEYISKNKEQYKQEESRSISYVVFDAAPTSTDSAASKKQLEDLKADFMAAQDPAAFLSRYGSTITYYDGYYGKSYIQVPAKDSIFALAKNQVYGPYQDVNSYILAKMIDFKPMPDSVKARHILIQTFNPQTGQQLLDDSTAKNRIDSIETAIRRGARFDSLAVKYSDDKGSGAKGGMLANPDNPATEYFNAGQMVKEFNDFCFEGKKGEMKVVKTIFGYHLIDILDQKNFQPHYKIAYFAKNIVASDETEQKVLEEASKFASESTNEKSFDESVSKSKLQKLTAENIRPNDVYINGINNYGPTRQLVREIFKASKGEVLKQERVGDMKTGYKYIVALVKDVLKEGTQPAYVARPSVEPVLRNKKKAEEIKKMIGNVTTLEAAAEIFKDSIKTVDSLRINSGALAFEPKITGAIFNAANTGKVIGEPLAGLQGVYVVRVDDLSSTPIASADIESQRAQLTQRTRQMQSFYSSPISVMRKLAKIKDNRRGFY